MVLSDIPEPEVKSEATVRSKPEEVITNVTKPETELKIRSKVAEKPKPSFFATLKERYSKLTPFQKYIAFLSFSTILIVTLAIYLYTVATTPTKAPPYLISKGLNYIEPKINLNRKSDSYTLLPPNKPRTEESPINGELFTKEEIDNLYKNAPVAVMVNNHVDARPQSNINQADIVFEAEAESGITRYLAIYWSNGSEKVGPIRSVRQYYLEWLSPFDPIFIHDGYASSENPKTDAGGNMYRYGTKTISTNGAWRVYDNGRVAPHNEYSSVTNAWKYGSSLGWNTFPEDFNAWEFKKDEPTGANGSGVKIKFNTFIPNGGYYDTTWSYNKDGNNYLRSFINGKDTDNETGEQISAKTVIIQSTSIAQTFNEKGHLITDTIGTGDAKILMDGNVIDATWRKNSRTDRTIYYDLEGNEIQFNRGRIWISVIDPNNGGDFDII